MHIDAPRPVTRCNGPTRQPSSCVQNFNFFATYKKKNPIVIIIYYTAAHVQNLSPFGPNLVEIFEVVERWVVVDVWVGVSTPMLGTMSLLLKNTSC
jgi:hypothetical protein